MTKINSRSVSKHKSYTIKELVEILGMNPKTISRWIDLGLRVLEGSKNPILVKGSELKEFLKNKNTKHKFKLDRNEFYCFKCKRPVHAKRGSREIKRNRETGTCTVCSGKIVRIIKRSQKDYKITSPPVQMSMLELNLNQSQNDKNNIPK